MINQRFSKLKNRWKAFSPLVQLLIAACILLIPAAAALWLIDRVFLYFVARSYVDEIAEAFDLNKHIARAIALLVFVILVFLIGKLFSLSKVDRRIGYLGIIGLLIGHALLLSLPNHHLEQCYILTRDGEVRFRERLGIDPETGRECRPVTPSVLERLLEYQKGRQAQRINSMDPTFFNQRSGEPIVWYFKDRDGNFQLFDLMGFHPESGVELLPVTPEIVDQWKHKNKDAIAKDTRPEPQRLSDPESFGFFDAVTGKPRIWYWRGQNGEYEFYDSSGYHRPTGEQLVVISREVISEWKGWIGLRQKHIERERLEREAALKRDLQAATELAAKRERERQLAWEREKREAADAAALREREHQSGLLCDQLAANPTDRGKPSNVAGVSYDVLKNQVSAALESCSLAVKVYPQELRYHYEYARALQVNNPEKAIEFHKVLATANYVASFDNIGSILIRTYKNIPQAIRYIREGVRHGDPDSMVSLANLIEKNYVQEANPTAARFALLSRAAQLGHYGAQVAVEQEQIKFQQLQQQREFEQQQQQMMLQLFGTVLQMVR